MLAGGTGIAPMFQALHPILKTPNEKTQIRLLYGNKTPNDILLKTELDELVNSYPERFMVYYVVGEEEFDDRAQEFGFESGWIDEEKIKRLAFPPQEDSIVWLCGVDNMYNSLAGSRLKPLTPGSVLHNLGYTDEMIWRS